MTTNNMADSLKVTAKVAAKAADNDKPMTRQRMKNTLTQYRIAADMVQAVMPVIVDMQDQLRKQIKQLVADGKIKKEAALGFFVDDDVAWDGYKKVLDESTRLAQALQELIELPAQLIDQGYADEELETEKEKENEPA